MDIIVIYGMCIVHAVFFLVKKRGALVFIGDIGPLPAVEWRDVVHFFNMLICCCLNVLMAWWISAKRTHQLKPATYILLLTARNIPKIIPTTPTTML